MPPNIDSLARRQSLIDGIDLVPNAEQTAELACRVYHDGHRMVGAPTKTMLKAGLLRSLDEPNY
jgi:hypothetical protein